MTDESRSTQTGASNEGTTETPQGMPSISGGSTPLPNNQNTSGMSDSTVPLNPNFRATKNYQGVKTEEYTNAQLVSAFAGKLGELVEWHRVELGDGREGLALFFPLDKWKIEGGAIVPK